MNQEIRSLIDQGAVFFHNHSGGKDSQASLIELAKHVPTSQIVVVHATLGDIEWHGALELARKQAADLGVPFIVAEARDMEGNKKDFFDMVERRLITKRGEVPPFPSSDCRQCTSDLKRGPINREILRYIREENERRDYVRPIDIIVNVEGIRAAESHKRAKLVAFKNRSHKRDGKELDPLSKAGRTAYDWLPIFELSIDEVFTMIRDAGQEPHWAYATGNERLSCVFCIMGSRNDLINGAKHRPELFERYVAWEDLTGYTMHESRKSLRELVGDAVKLAA